jgi:parallel beta-helix repeat protein
MQISKLLLTAALRLIMSAFTIHTGYAQVVAIKSPPIQISSLPFNITAPGTYVLTGNLNSSGGAGISVNSSVSGPIVIDLKGYTLSGTGILVQFCNSGVTVRNGTVSNAGFCVYVGHSTNVSIDNITVHNCTIAGIYFNGTDSSTISNCRFINDQYSLVTGIQDYDTQGGNQFNNNTFDGNREWTLIVWNSVPSVLERYEFAEPPSN